MNYYHEENYTEEEDSINEYLLGDLSSRTKLGNYKFSFLNNSSHRTGFGKTKEEIRERKIIFKLLIKHLNTY